MNIIYSIILVCFLNFLRPPYHHVCVSAVPSQRRFSTIRMKNNDTCGIVTPSGHDVSTVLLCFSLNIMMRVPRSLEKSDDECIPGLRFSHE